MAWMGAQLSIRHLQAWRRGARLIRTPYLYLEWAFTTLLAGLAVLGNLYGLFPMFESKEIIFLSGCLFGFGVINVTLMWGLSAYKVRYKRAQRAYATIHDVAEEARNLRDKITKENSRRAIDAICFVHLEGLLRDFLGFVPKITLKYVEDEHLKALRSRNQSGRSDIPEPVKENEIFGKLVKHMDKFKAIYVRDLNDREEVSHTFGVDCDNVKNKCGGKYRTFIALPLRWSRYSDGQLPMKGTIGMLGLDDERPGAFEDLEEEDFQAFYAIVDILSECVINWQRSQGAPHGTV